MDIDQVALQPDATLPFRLRLRVGAAVPVEAPRRIADAARGLREGGAAVARRTERVAELLDALGSKGWRLVGDDLVGDARETVDTTGFAASGAGALPPAVTVARDARPDEIAADLTTAFGGEHPEIAAETTVKLDGYDLPVRLEGGSLMLVYSLRTFLETFSVRG